MNRAAHRLAVLRVKRARLRFQQVPVRSALGQMLPGGKARTFDEVHDAGRHQRKFLVGAPGRIQILEALFRMPSEMGYSQSVTFVTGHLQDGVVKLDWEALPRVGPPGLVIIGEVVRLRRRLDWFGGAEHARHGTAESVA